MQHFQEFIHLFFYFFFAWDTRAIRVHHMSSDFFHISLHFNKFLMSNLHVFSLNVNLSTAKHPFFGWRPRQPLLFFSVHIHWVREQSTSNKRALKILQRVRIPRATTDRVQESLETFHITWDRITMRQREEDKNLTYCRRYGFAWSCTSII